MALTPTTEDLRVPEPVPGRAAVAPDQEPEATRERPVFADAAGRRRVWFRTLVQGLCVVAAVWLAALLLGLLAPGSLPGLPRIAGGDDGDVQALEATGSDSTGPKRAVAGSRSSNRVAAAFGASGAALSHQLAAAIEGWGFELSGAVSERRSAGGDPTTLGEAIEQGRDDAARINRPSDLRHRSSGPSEHPRGGGRREPRGILVGPRPRGGPHTRAIEAPSEIQRRQQPKHAAKQQRQRHKQTVKQERQRHKQTVKQQPRQLPSASSPVRPQPKLKPRPAPPVPAPTAPKPKPRPAPPVPAPTAPKPKPKPKPRPAPRPAAAPPTPMAETPGAIGSAKAGARRTVPKATPRRGG